MALRICTVESCKEPADRYSGSCMICSNHLCAAHLRENNHTCPSMDRDPKAFYPAYGKAKKQHLTTLLSKINTNALQAVASRARQGIPCRIPAFSNNVDPESLVNIVSGQYGGQNCHLDVVFADGVTWLARVRLDDPLLPPAAVQAHIFLSEVATLEFLANTKIPAPRVYAYELESPENPVGTSYVLMEKFSGHALDWNRASAEQRARVMEQLADVYLELEKHPIPFTGSLVPHNGASEDGRLQVGAFAQTPCFKAPEQGLGPFKTLKEAYTAIICQQLRMISSREVSALPVDNYLALLWRLATLPELVAGSESRTGPFYLKHYDDKGDHIMVDDDYNITGIIDWEFASAEAKEMTFSSPCMMWPVRQFFNGDNALHEDEMRFAAMFEKRGRGDIAEMVRGGRRWQRFLFFLGGGMARDMAEFEALFQGLRESFAGEAAVILSYKDWRAAALYGFAKEDADLQALIQAESLTVTI